MKTVGLKLYLIILMITVATISLIFTSGFVLYQSNEQSEQQIRKTLETTSRLLNVQLIRISTNFERPENFPDLNLWKEADKYSGMCIHFSAIKSHHERRVCKGYLSEGEWPKIFEKIYRWFFDPSNTRTKEIEYGGVVYGTLKVQFNDEYTLLNAWESIKKLMGLSFVTVVSLILMLTITFGHALKPSKVIIKGLDNMSENGFDSRLPNFFITEWHQTGQAINQLASELQTTLKERKALSLKLVNIQEEERKFIARELHDELGQSLAGLSAIGALIVQLADKNCRILVSQGEKVNSITAHMMSFLQQILLHLRPADFDELGLVESLKNMINAWNSQRAGTTNYELQLEGDLTKIPDTVSMNIFRIVQECLTNIAKHSHASRALIRIEHIDKYKNNLFSCIKIHIEDNGVAKGKEYLGASSGIGILGIYERVKIFDGKVNFHTLQPNGLVVDIEIPIPNTTECEYENNVVNRDYIGGRPCDCQRRL